MLEGCSSQCSTTGVNQAAVCSTLCLLVGWCFLSRTEEPAKAGTCAHDRHTLQQLALNVHIKHSRLAWPGMVCTEDPLLLFRECSPSSGSAALLSLSGPFPRGLTPYNCKYNVLAHYELNISFLSSATDTLKTVKTFFRKTPACACQIQVREVNM